MASTKSAATRGVQAVFSLKPAAVAVAVALSLGGGARFALANPTGATVVNGQVTMNQAGNLLSITNSPNSIINWQGFSIGANEITRFTQQSAASAILNRVVGAGGAIDPSVILGALQSNGRVFLINPAGIVFGAGSQIDVAGLVASSLNLSNADFLGGRLRFTEMAGAGAVVNQGSINAASGGQVYLVGPSVTNSGIITSPKGEVILAAGNTVELVNPGTPNLRVEITAPENEARNLGSIVADAGRVGIYAGLVTQNGTIRADSAVATDDGRIILKATKDVSLGAGSITTANGPTGGRIEINAGDTALVAGTVEAKGASGQGGVVHVLGDKVGIYGNARVDVSGETGGGTVLAGGEFQGRPGVTAVEGAAIRNAASTFFGADASIAADAVASGDGGKVILWSDGTTRSYGAISARGGAASGNGGFVETSGKGVLDVTRGPDLRAPHGLGGTWLLDPNDLVVDFGSALVNNTAQPMFSTLGESSFVGVDLINLQLNAGSSVLLTTTSQGPANGAQQGNITIKAPILKSASTAASTPGTVIGTTDLLIRAHNNIIIESTGGIAATESVGPLGTPVQADRLNVTLTADIDGTGGGGVILGGGIATKGGTVSISGRDVVAINAPINTTRAGSNAGSVTLSSANGSVSVAAPVNGAAFSATAQGAGATVGISAPVNGTSVTLNSTAGGVSVGAAVNATSSFQATAGGAGANLAISAPVTASSATLTADTMDIQAPVTAGAGGITVRQSASSRPMNLGTKVAGALSLTQSELSNLVTMGPVTFGTSQTGAFTIAAPITAGSSQVTIVSGVSFNVSPGASLTTAVPLFVTAPATVIDGNINAQRASFTTNSMAVNATVNSATDIDIFSNSVVVNLGDGTFGGLHLTQSELNNLVSGGTLRIGTNSILTIQESISRAGTLSLFGSGGITAQPGKGISATSLALDTTGSATLNGPNVVGTLAARVPGSLSFSNNGPLTIGTVDTLAGLRGFFPSSQSTSITLAADNLNVSAPIRASSVTLMPMNPASVRLDLGGADVPGMTLGITDGELDQIFAGMLTLKADRADISAPVSATTMTVLNIAPATPVNGGDPTNRALRIVSSKTDPTSLELTPGDIANVTRANSFILGDAMTGPVTLDAPLTATNFGVFTLRSGDTATGITINHPLATAAGANFSTNSIALTADAMAINNTVSTGTGNIVVVPNRAGGVVDVDLGTNTAGKLSLDTSEVGMFSAPAGKLTIGSSGTGNVDITDAVTFGNSGILEIVSGNTLTLHNTNGTTPHLHAPHGILLTAPTMLLDNDLTSTVSGDIVLTADTLTIGSGGDVATTAGNITLTADTLALNAVNPANGNVTAGGGFITVRPRNFAFSLTLGGAGAGTYLNDAELHHLKPGNGLLRIGDLSNTGGIDFVGNVSAPAAGSATTFSLMTTGNVTQSAGSISVSRLAAQASGSIALTGNNDIDDVALRSLFGDVSVTYSGTNPLTVAADIDNLGGVAAGFFTGNNIATITTNELNIESGASVSANQVFIAPLTAAQPITLGAKTGLGLDQADLNRISTNKLTLGNMAHTGGITVTAGPLDVFTNLDLVSGGGSITANTGLSVSGTLGLTAPAMTFNGMLTANSIDIKGGSSTTQILLGGADGMGTLGLDSTDLGNLGAANKSLTTAAGGNITVNSAFSASGDLALTADDIAIAAAVSGGSVTLGTVTAGRTINLNPAPGPAGGFLGLMQAEADFITTTGGPLTIAGGSLVTSNDIAFANVHSLVLRADSMTVTNDISVPGAQRITVAPRSPGFNMELGANPAGGISSLGLAQADINHLKTAGTLQLGDGATSTIRVVGTGIAQPAGTGALALVARPDGGGFITQSAGAPITAAQLLVSALNGTVDLQDNNLVAVLAGSAFDTTFKNAQPLTIGSVDGTAGLAGTFVALKSRGLSIMEAINGFSVTLAPYDAGATMSLGMNPGGTQFGIDGATELPRINASFLTFGDTTTGAATVNGAMVRTSGALNIVTGPTQAVNVNAALTGPDGVSIDSGTININVGGAVSAPSGDIFLTAHAAATLNVSAPVTAGGSIELSSAVTNVNAAVSASNSVEIFANTASITAPITVHESFGSVTIAPLAQQPAPAPAVVPVSLGVETPGALSLTKEELAFISAPDITIGRSSVGGGDLTIAAPISLAVNRLTLRTGGSIVQAPDAAIQLVKTVPGQFGPVKVGNLRAFSGGSVDLRAANVVPGSLDGSIAANGTFDFNNTLPMLRDSTSSTLRNILLSALLNPPVAQRVRITSAPFGPLPPAPPAPAAGLAPVVDTQQVNANFQAQLLAAIDKISDINDTLDATSEEDRKKAEEEKKKQQECS